MKQKQLDALKAKYQDTGNDAQLREAYDMGAAESRSEINELKAIISKVCDKSAESGNSEIFHIAASRNICLRRVKAEAYSNVSEIMRYEFDGPYTEKGVGDFFDEYANKLEQGE